jgi:hypothetical protein
LVKVITVYTLLGARHAVTQLWIACRKDELKKQSGRGSQLACRHASLINEVSLQNGGRRRNPWEGIYPDTPTEAMQADIFKNEVCKKRRKGGGTPGKGYIPIPLLKPGRQTSIRMK